MFKITMAAAGAAGFLLGSRAGRGPYESFLSQVQRVREDPEVRQRAAQARETVTDAASEAAQTVRDKAAQASGGNGVAAP